MKNQKPKSKKKTVAKSQASAELRSTDGLGHGHTFELDGAILSINQEYQFERGEVWIDFQGLTGGLTSGGQCRKVEGLPIPPTALPFIKPGSTLKIKVTIVA